MDDRYEVEYQSDVRRRGNLSGEDFHRAEELAARFAGYAGTLGESAGHLLEAL